jgi:hypothetical protein
MLTQDSSRHNNMQQGVRGLHLAIKENPHGQDHKPRSRRQRLGPTDQATMLTYLFNLSDSRRERLLIWYLHHDSIAPNITNEG